MAVRRPAWNEGKRELTNYLHITKTRQDMIELYLSKNRNETSPSLEGTIEGILRDFVKCVREQTLNGNTVKVDDLAIFKVSVVGNGCAKLYDADVDKAISASIGTMKKTDKTGPAVQSLKLLAQATGEYTRDELNKDGKLSWTDKAEEMIAEAKAGNGVPSSNGGGSSNTNPTNGGGTNTGGNTGTVTPSNGGGGDNGGNNTGGGDDTPGGDPGDVN